MSANNRRYDVGDFTLGTAILLTGVGLGHVGHDSQQANKEYKKLNSREIVKQGNQQKYIEICETGNMDNLKARNKAARQVQDSLKMAERFTLTVT